ncbi:GNAT family N-acetyltransferase [Actinotalea sp. K2]|uniref:GNAT family N-acetyltransferase n=1 Tax=Actinotalea sp. K2 TaxID=2939438 RepID=UPI002016FB22|nr:GNAT family N-acetyltransferase [Actinotalea sp. K2]MCL3859687.1 GNAT family N-acetyltransferase [Actinotalea sp. K2]
MPADQPRVWTIRSARPDDADALYDICLRTGDAGKDATGLYRDPRLLGEVWVGPYLALAPELAFVLTAPGPDGEALARHTGQEGGAVAPPDRVVGYVLGVARTDVFEDRCEADWWPALRQRYPRGSAAPGTPEAELLERVHHPPRAPRGVVVDHPAHLHVDLLPEVQGGGNGRRLLERLFAALRAAGAPGVHLGVDPANGNAVAFYRHLGFRASATPGLLVRDLP